MNAAQKWMGTGRVSSILEETTVRTYGSSKTFCNPAGTRFCGKLLQVKRWQDMKRALRDVVQSQKYTRFNFADDDYAFRIIGTDLWDLMDTVTDKCGPLLLLTRLADSTKPTLTKMKAVIEYLKTLFVDEGEDSLEDLIAQAFHNRVSRMESDVMNAAYILDQQFVKLSINADEATMTSFWKVARAVLRVNSDVDWVSVRVTLSKELTKFRMKTGGFPFENYDTPDTCSFWVTAGCYAPTLKRLAMCLVALPCASSEAERNWQEVKMNRTKKRNRLGSEKLEKMVFVRRFLRMKRLALFDDDEMPYKAWVDGLFKTAMRKLTQDEWEDVGHHDDDVNEVVIFQDRIEPGEQNKINGREPGQARRGLVAVKADNAGKSWLFQKYYEMCFVDKNPDGDAEDEPLDDEDLWEHRVVRNIVWSRQRGWVIDSALYGEPDEQSLETYQINSSLIEMIRVSPHNIHTMSINQQETTQEDTPNDDDESSDDNENESHSVEGQVTSV